MPTKNKKPATKKVVRKKTTKKVVKKATKKTAKQKLITAPQDQSFWVTDGQVLGTLADLQAALKLMSDDAYEHHVGKEYNHFADWVEVILCDKKCAAALRRARTQAGAAKAVGAGLKLYQA